MTPAWTIFYNPMPLQSHVVLWMVLPLCMSVAVVYKTIRVRELRRLPREAAGLILYISAGLVALGAGLWLLTTYWPR
jgi:hypothetical protein